MSLVKNTLGIEVEFKPWTDTNYRVNYLHIFESIGGELASGDIHLWHDNSDDALDLVTNETTGTLVIRDTKEGGTGIEYEIPIFITRREFYRTTLDLNFICIPDVSFIESPISTEYDDITDALNSLYPGNIDIRTDTDLDNDIKIYQMCETNYDLCTRLAYSFKHDTIFAYSWDGFMLKELCGEKNSQGDTESLDDPPIKLGALGLMNYTTKYNLTYNADLNFAPVNTWEDSDNSATQTDYSDYEFKNCRAITDYDVYCLCGTKYQSLVENYRYNKNLMDANIYSKMIITGGDFPGYKLGDVIKFTSPEQVSSYPFEVFLVASNEIFFATETSDTLSPNGKMFEWTTKLYGLDNGTWAEKKEEES